MMMSLSRRIRPILLLFAIALLCDAAPTQGLASPDDLAALEEQAMQAAAAQVAPSVVRIETLGGAEQVDGQLVSSGATTGVVVSEDGYILSSAFGLAGQPSSILVTLPSGKRNSATIVARDSNRMLVLLKVNTDEKLVVPQSVPRDQLSVGQWALAVGRTYEGSPVNVSVGILTRREPDLGQSGADRRQGVAQQLRRSTDRYLRTRNRHPRSTLASATGRDGGCRMV